MLLRFFVATFFRFVARFGRGRIEDPSFNWFALNGIQRGFFGGNFVGGILSGYQTKSCLIYATIRLAPLDIDEAKLRSPETRGVISDFALGDWRRYSGSWGG